jgi:hypothetical protein
MSTWEPVELRPGLVRVPRRRLRDSLMSVVAAMLLVGAGGVAGAALQRAETRVAATKAEGAAAEMRVSAAREEVRAIALDACRAREQLRRLALDAECAAGRGSKIHCDRGGEGQYRFDPCSRYLPDDWLHGACPFPGAC